MKILNNANFSLNSSKIEANSDTITTIPVIVKIQQNQPPCKTAKSKVIFQALQTQTLTASVTQAVFFYLKFLSPMGKVKLLDLLHSSEFAVRAIRRNKTGNRTNNASRSVSVVEPLPHSIKSGNLLLTETQRQFKMLYKFLLLGERRLKITIRAKSEAEARQRIKFTSPVICYARLSEGGIYA